MTFDDPKTPYPIRMRWVWGVAEVEVQVSARGMKPLSFRPDTALVYELAEIPEDAAAHTLLRLCIEKFPVMANAVATLGLPDIMQFRDLNPSPSADPQLGGPHGIVN